MVAQWVCGLNVFIQIYALNKCLKFGIRSAYVGYGSNDIDLCRFTCNRRKFNFSTPILNIVYGATSIVI